MKSLIQYFIDFQRWFLLNYKPLYLWVFIVSILTFGYSYIVKSPTFLANIIITFFIYYASWKLIFR